MKYHLISALLLVAAVTLESLGVFGGGAVLLAVGIGCEIWFWVRVVRSRRSSRVARSV